MRFPDIPEDRRLASLEPREGVLGVVLDTDAYNEIDDQFAIVHALLSPERLHVQAIYAAPFLNARSSSPADGMEKSYEELLRLLGRLGRPAKISVYRGATRYLGPDFQPVECPASLDLVQRAMASGDQGPLYVVAIGAPTNVASAILIEPRIIERIVVVWLGGHALHWPNAREFNLNQDVPAARLLFDCGVPLVHVPCLGVASHLSTTVAEIDQWVRGRGAIGDYLANIFCEYADLRRYANGHRGWSKVLWDLAAVAYLLDASWVETDTVRSPLLTDQLTWAAGENRHLVRCARYVDRGAVFRDLFTKMETASGV